MLVILLLLYPWWCVYTHTHVNTHRERGSHEVWMYSWKQLYIESTYIIGGTWTWTLLHFLGFWGFITGLLTPCDRRHPHLRRQRGDCSRLWGQQTCRTQLHQPAQGGEPEANPATGPQAELHYPACSWLSQMKPCREQDSAGMRGAVLEHSQRGMDNVFLMFTF